MSLVKRIDSVFLPVRNLKHSEQWYKNLFGLEPVFRSDDGRYVGFRFPQEEVIQTALTLYQVTDIPKLPGQLFNFYTEDVYATYEALKDKGANVSAIHTAEGMTFFDMTDPDGHEIGVVTFPEK
ncbi:VOC family protein [Evansella halocellulosilytica]|uniref:VOC family protein n=1 Tax=Evansella halocellulosilytica TaxID=2011013 RepID=UPI000BB67702|nr:VOC family protein [Evansella halocellulosilytica]